MIRFFAITIAAATGLLISNPLDAAIVANFADGNGAGVDGYQGSAGSGWNGPWGNGTVQAGTLTTQTVVNSSSLNGGDNYFSGVFTSNNATNSRGFINRNYDTFGDINVAQPHRIEFDFRFDSALTNFSTTTDYIALYDHAGTSTDTGAASTWIVRVHGATDGTGLAKQWVWYNGDPASTTFSNTRWVDSGLTLVSGDVYHIIVDTDPATETYTSSIRNLTTNAVVSSGTLNYRSSANNTFTAGSVLHFGGRVNTLAETFSFSVDSVNITAVPEPSTWALGLVAGLALPWVYRRRQVK